MKFIVFVLCVAVIGVAAYVLRPTQDAHRARVAELLHLQGLPPAPPTGRLETYRDLYVTTGYELRANDRVIMQCWGAFRQFVCFEPDPATQKAEQS